MVAHNKGRGEWLSTAGGSSPPRCLPDRRLRTKAAADRARKVARDISDAATQRDELSEETLFVALQTCAYRASRGKDRDLWEKRWRAIREYIVDANLGLAFSMLSRFRRSDIDWEEQRSEALFALLRAVDGFNPWSGFRFSTYACSAIARSLIQWARKSGKHRWLLNLEDDGQFERPEQGDPWYDAHSDRLRHALKSNLGQLTAREAIVLGWRFPLNGGLSMTLGQIGSVIGLSKERVRQIQEDALSKLRNVLEAEVAAA